MGVLGLGLGLVLACVGHDQYQIVDSSSSSSGAGQGSFIMWWVLGGAMHVCVASCWPIQTHEVML